MTSRTLVSLLGTALVVAGCSGAPAPPPAAEPAPAAPAARPANYQPVVSLNEMMVAVVDSHSHEIWDVEDKAPATDADWATLEHAAVTLAASGSLTMLSGNGPDDQKWTQQPDWQRHSQTLSDAGLAAMKAVQAKDIDAVRKAGDALVLTCINCHREYKLNVPKIWSDHEGH